MRFGAGVRFPGGPQGLSGRTSLLTGAHAARLGRAAIGAHLSAEAKAKAAASTSGGSPTIPMSWNDSRFAGNTAGVAEQAFTTGSFSNLDWNENPGYSDGNQCCTWGGPGNLTLSKCRVDWREGPRIAGDSGTFTVDQCFISCVGTSTDHADGMQAYDPGGNGNVTVTNTCFRSYSDNEAAAVYGSGFIGSDAFFWADSYQGTVTFNNVLVWGGARGVSIYADTGTTHVNFQNVYFVLGNGDSSWEFYNYDIKPTGGTLTVDNWTNVCAATIVNGVIVPGATLPSPPT